jgi:hypothetical protein
MQGSYKPVCHRIKRMKNIEHLPAAWHLFNYVLVLPIILSPAFKRSYEFQK